MSNFKASSLFPLAVAATLTSGCHLFRTAEQEQQRELEMVARRWCMTMRASQIIPIYPLNEDVVPGDVFVVETPAQRQAKDYAKRGYLDLEHLMVRLNSLAYANFYQGGHGIGTLTNTPRHWQFPDSQAWSNAPLAGFPSYSVEVKKGGGFNAAFPISGIPVGLSLVNSKKANATVQITRAHTFGLDQNSLEAPFRQWLATNGDLVAQFARPTNGSTAYLRLVTRVFAANALNVTVSGARAGSFSGSGGAARPVDLSTMLDTNAVANYTNSLGALSRMVDALAGSAPGGTLKLASATTHSVSLNQTFARPLVIGYIAQDYPILEDGRLGNPISTKDVLEGRIPDPLAVSLAGLRAERRAAELVADQCVGRLRRLTAEQLRKAVERGAEFKILSDLQKTSLTTLVAQDARKATDEFITALRVKSRSGDVRSRCDLHEFLDALSKL